MSGTYLNDAQFSIIKDQITSGVQHKVDAYKQLIEMADAAIENDLLTITINGGSPHIKEDAVYVPGKDGVTNTEANTAGSQILEDLSTRCFALAIAWKLSGDDKYAERLLEYIHAWCLNQNTKMIPDGYIFDHFTPGMGYGGDICLFHRLPPFFLSMYVVSGYQGWNISARAAVKRWVRSMIEPQLPEMFFQGVAMYNNWEDNRLNYLSAGAFFLDDMDILHNVFRRWREILPLKMTETGELHRETMRTRSMTYSLLSLNRYCQVAAIAEGFGEDLLNYSHNGKSIKLAIDYVTDYLFKMDQWPHKLIDPVTPGKGRLALGVLEQAYAKWGEEKYLKAIEIWAPRPIAHYHSTLLN